MSELKVYRIIGIEFDSQFYHKSEVDKVIAELETENESLLQQNRELCRALQVMYSKEEYDKLQRALWLARVKKAEVWERYWQIKQDLLFHTCMYASKALFALEGYENYPDTEFLHHTYRLAAEWELVWRKVKLKCRAYADKFKEG